MNTKVKLGGTTYLFLFLMFLFIVDARPSSSDTLLPRLYGSVKKDDNKSSRVSQEEETTTTSLAQETTSKESTSRNEVQNRQPKGRIMKTLNQMDSAEQDSQRGIPKLSTNTLMKEEVSTKRMIPVSNIERRMKKRTTKQQPEVESLIGYADYSYPSHHPPHHN